MTKKPWASKTMWGAFIMLAAMLLRASGVVELSPDEQDQLADKLASMGTVASEVGAIALVIWGRLTAKKGVGL